MTGRELRLRARIDALTEERDAALAALCKARASRYKWCRKAQAALASRDLWKHRALERSRSRRYSTAPVPLRLDGHPGTGAKEEA